jgi:hypothetical protein
VVADPALLGGREVERQIASPLPLLMQALEQLYRKGYNP